MPRSTTPTAPTVSILLRTTLPLQSFWLQTDTRLTIFGKLSRPESCFPISSLFRRVNIKITRRLIVLDSLRNGRFRAIYQVPVTSSSTSVTGKIHVDVHYYEDGNVALNTTKSVKIPVASIGAESIISRIAAAERDYQEELNRAFVRMAEGAFKGLRRQLPITRQKVEWEKVGGYRLGQDISGGKGR